MRNPWLSTISILGFLFGLGLAIADAKNLDDTAKRTPVNYTVILDLSDRVLNENQLDYDVAQIKLIFDKFKKKAKQNLIITSKDRFVVKIIRQKGSTLNVDYYENILQLRLDQLSIKDKNKKLEELDAKLVQTLTKLKKDAIQGENTNDYAGVDLWSFLNNNKSVLATKGYENNIIIMTDGYLDFENSTHVIKEDNQYTGTKFLRTLKGNNWKELAIKEEIGILPIPIDFEANWIISGLKSKDERDLYQLSKIKYFWDKWVQESAKTQPDFINYSTESQILSELNSILK